MPWTTTAGGGVEVGLAARSGTVCCVGSRSLPWWYAARPTALTSGENVRVLAIKCPPQERPRDGL